MTATDAPRTDSPAPVLDLAALDAARVRLTSDQAVLRMSEHDAEQLSG